jgi:hypothetical protein
MLTLTLDTNCIDHVYLRAAAAAANAELATFSVSRKEMGNSSFAAHLRDIAILPEQTVWADGFWADGFWVDRFWTSAIDVPYRLPSGIEMRGDPFEAIIGVVSNGSFSPRGQRKYLTDGQRRQFRDAMILSLHAQYRRDVFVTADKRAFINNGRCALLETMLLTRIRTPTEAIQLLSNGSIS